MRKYWYWALFCWSLWGCYKEEITFDATPNEALEMPLLLELDGKACLLDAASQQLRHCIGADSIVNFNPRVAFQAYSEVKFKQLTLHNNTQNNLGTIRVGEVYPVEIMTGGEVHHFTLVFTKFPLVQLVTKDVIVDEPQRMARLNLYYPSPNQAPVSHFVGLEHRGGYSQTYPKKSYGFSFFNPASLGSKISKSLFNHPPNESWILDALYADPSKIRNSLCFQLWAAVEPDPRLSIQTHLVEVYLNNQYQGLYSLNEQMNGEHLGLGATGALYKATGWADGATRFEHLKCPAPTIEPTWEGWEQKHPKPKEAIHWSPLYHLRDWVVNKDSLAFRQELSQQVDLHNMVQYYLFMNLVAASDNYGKNLFWMQTHTAAPLSMIPWDMDATWGLFWSGDPFHFTGLLSNTLFDRLLQENPQQFRTLLKNQWAAWRAGPWSTTQIQAQLQAALEPLLDSDVLALEERVWGIPLDLPAQQQYMQQWMGDRLVFLDNYYAGL